MKKISIPINNAGNQLEKVKPNGNLIFGTTTGLVKRINEDSISYKGSENFLTICVSDGHWGSEASRVITEHWLQLASVFPDSKIAAAEETLRIENKIFADFRHKVINPDEDFTPEAAFIAIELRKRKLSIVSYGDCRLLVVRDGKIIYTQCTSKTWLGVFSRLGLRGRRPVKQAIKFKSLALKSDDIVLIFTDGVDECVYEEPTIDTRHIATLTKLVDPAIIFDTLMDEVLKNGAEDNASLVVVKVI